MSNQFLEELQEWTQILGKVNQELRYRQKAIKEEFLLPELKDRLLSLPEKIKASQIDALNKKSELAEIEQRMKQREAEIMFEINGEEGEKGKPKFSNEPLRKAELTKRLVRDQEYRDIKEEYSKVEFRIWEHEGEADNLRREFQALLAHKDLIVAELNLYAK